MRSKLLPNILQDGRKINWRYHNTYFETTFVDKKLLQFCIVQAILVCLSKYIQSTDANLLNATHPFTWKGCIFWVVATWKEYEILKKNFIVNEI